MSTTGSTTANTSAAGTGDAGPDREPGVVAGPRAADWARAVTAVRDLGADARVLLVCHVNPDGDALGSMLGFGLGLRSLGLPVQASFAGPFEVPEPLRPLPGMDMLVPAEQALAGPDLLVCFDAASANRLGDLADRLDTAGSSIVLDHHASNGGFGDINLVDRDAAATAVVVEQLLTRLGVRLDAPMAECLYVALATDTGSFKFEMTTPLVHEMAARLLATGIKPAEISRRVFDSRPFGAVRLYGEVLGRAEYEPAAAAGRGMVWSFATLADLERHGQRPYVLEGLIDAVRCAEEADVACVAKQVGPREWSISLRSKGAVDVGGLAVALGGGGHRSAAGFTGFGELPEVIDSVRAALPGHLR